jgi:hypothetical protein
MPVASAVLAPVTPSAAVAARAMVMRLGIMMVDNPFGGV